MATDAQNVTYTGITTTTVPIVAGQNLQLILQHIDASINTHNTAPDYTGYNLYCVKQVDGTTHPTNTQNFAEGISKNLCDFHTTYTTFTGTTYPAAQTVFTSAINGLQNPALTYATYSITSGMTITQVWNALFTGITGTINSINPAAANWSTLSISPNPSTIVTAFNDIIAYLSALNTTVSGKQAAISNIDNSANCLAGTASDTIRATVVLLTTYACALPTYTAGSITWGGVSAGTTLQNSIQNIVNTVSTLLTNGVVQAGTGLTLSAVGSTYQGKKLAIDTTYTTLYKVMNSSADTTPNFLSSKIVAGTGISVATLNAAGNETFEITNSSPNTDKVKINANDSTANYLANKIPSTVDTTWGLSLYSSASSDNSLLNLIPTISDPNLTITSILSYISTSPTLLLQFTNLIAQTTTTTGTAVSNLVVTLTATNLVLTWTHQSGTSQISKWRQFGGSDWFTSGFTVANPLSGVAATNTYSSPATNVVFDFQIDTVYSGGTIGSNIRQGIYYTGQTLSDTIVAGVISVNQSQLQLDAIQYRLKNAGAVVLENISTTGQIPQVAFSAQASGNYTVEWRYGTLINGVTLYSDDVLQHNAYYVSGTITIP